MPQVAELREQLLSYGDRLRELREKPVDQRSADWREDIRTTRDLILALDAELVVHERSNMFDQLGLTGDGPRGGTGQANGLVEFRTVGDLFTTNDEVEQWRSRGARGQSPSIEIDRRALVSTLVGDANGSLLLPKQGPMMGNTVPRQRRVFVRDLIAGGSTSLNSIPYVRELNSVALELGASAVAEGSAKPEVTITFESDDAPVRTVAAWIPTTMQVLEDVPTLRSYIDGRLTYMIALREEDEIINGPGTGARLKGILAFDGVQTQTYVNTDKAATIGMAISRIEMVDGEADGIAINPVDFWTMATTRNANKFDAQAVEGASGSPFGNPPTSLWGLPAVRSRAVTQGQALVGAWRLGAQVFDRSTVSIRVTDSHSDWFVYNKLVILAESRLALAVHRPDFFVKATIA